MRGAETIMTIDEALQKSEEVLETDLPWDVKADMLHAFAMLHIAKVVQTLGEKIVDKLKDDDV
jgi:hypothetical protein